ncbi:type I polyketide synthase [Streptomyces sp. HPF1205]|uniref:type I polyketide synthase n=1 Tax=Streptomyces sp. HPF1205 TaxID=2873262 RepID=UPI001CEC31DC|nr:type I polyketide synthase [Streptomyces sp. HPF1205]
MTTATDQRRLLEQALRQVREARARVDRAERARREPVAVVGAAVRAPGGVEDMDGLWRLLSEGTDTVTPWRDDPTGRRDGSAGRDTGRWAGLLSRIDGFDAEFFGIGSDEADHMDPQQRLLLEAAWEAVEDAGIPAETLKDRTTGVFLGIYGSDYLGFQLSGQAGISAYTAPGGTHSIAANRLSYLLDLHGPSMAVDTACSSSLVALHLAVQSLRNGECDAALVGGVNLVLAESTMSATEKVLPMASGGRCRAFDADADGIVRAEGCGVVLLEKLDEALARGHRIRAVVRGSAVNHNGRTNGLTAPSPRGQAELLRRALADAAADPADVSYVEAHGTGTRLGDPIEAEAIRQVYGTGPLPCAIGSVKTNFGHQEAAAGIIGLLKTVLVLDRRQVPPTLHLDRLNPEIDLDGSRLTVPTALTGLAGRDRPLAAVSSFGFGGANVHVVLQAAPPREPAPAAAAPVRDRLLLPLSARSAAALGQLAAAYADRLDGPGLQDAREAARLCAAAANGRSHHPYRLCASAADAAGLAAELRSARTEFLRPQPPGRRIAFVFGGQGTQWAGMGRDLLAREPVVLAEAEACDAVVRELAGWSVLEELRAPAGADRPDRTEMAQVCIAVLQLGLVALWRSWGVRPQAVAGHSMGEIVAACVAGALDRRQALELLVVRARITEAGARGGAMSGIALPAARVEELVAGAGGRIAVAAVNGPRSTVVAGDPDRVEAVEAAAAVLGARVRRLPVAYAFHSPLLDGRDTELADAARHLVPGAGDLPQYSTVTGGRIRPADLTPEHWGRNLRGAVLFADAVRAMADDGITGFVEIGPHPALVRDILATVEDRVPSPVVVGSLRRDRPAGTALDAALAGLYRGGADPSWDTVLPPPDRPVALPAYPWQRRRHWLAPRSAPAPAAPAPAAQDPARQDDPSHEHDEHHERHESAPLAAASPAEPAENLERYVRRQLADALDLPDGSALPPDGSLESLGLNSLMIVELKNRIERDFAVAVPLQALLEGGGIDGLVRTVAESLAADTVTVEGRGAR